MKLFTYTIPSSFLSIPFFKLMADYDLLGTKLSVVLAMITLPRLMPSGSSGTTAGPCRPTSMKQRP